MLISYFSRTTQVMSLDNMQTSHIKIANWLSSLILNNVTTEIKDYCLMIVKIYIYIYIYTNYIYKTLKPFE